MASSTSTPNQLALAKKTAPILAILADVNVQDPKPATLREVLGCDFILHRVTDMPSLLRFNHPAGALKYLVVACLSPLIADYSAIVSNDDREVALGKICFLVILKLKLFVMIN